MHTGTWLKSVREQEAADGVDHRDLACDPLKLTARTREELLQAVQHIQRALSGIPLPLDSYDQQREMWEDGRTVYVGALREAASHLGAALTAVSCTDKELGAASDLASEAQRCCVCDTEVLAKSPPSMVLPAGTFLCDEELCQEKYEGAETISFSVRDMRQGALEKA